MKRSKIFQIRDTTGSESQRERPKEDVHTQMGVDKVWVAGGTAFIQGDAFRMQQGHFLLSELMSDTLLRMQLSNHLQNARTSSRKPWSKNQSKKGRQEKFLQRVKTLEYTLLFIIYEMNRLSYIVRLI